MAEELKGSSAQWRGNDPGSATLDSKPRAATRWLRPQAHIWPLTTSAAHLLQEVIITAVGHAGVQSRGKPAGVGQAGPILALTKSVGPRSPQGAPWGDPARPPSLCSQGFHWNLASSA